MVVVAILGGFVSHSSCADEPGVIRLTTDGELKQRPNWSPDGERVVFARHRGASIFLFLRDVKSGREERLTTQTSPEYDAVFSPDGKELLLAFDKLSPNQGDIEVHRLALSDRKLTPVATTQGALSHEESPCWSPDGKRFAFTSTRHGNQELYVADIQGGDWLRLTTDPAIDAHPAWSPDGKLIAFATDRWGDLEIALIEPDGSNLRRLTESKALDDYPAWSPDGHRLAFTSNRDGNLEIYVQPLDGPARNVTRHPAIDKFPAWTRDGRIGFVSNRDGGFELYLTPTPIGSECGFEVAPSTSGEASRPKRRNEIEAKTRPAPAGSQGPILEASR
jgi:TolB protein